MFDWICSSKIWGYACRQNELPTHTPAFKRHGVVLLSCIATLILVTGELAAQTVLPATGGSTRPQQGLEDLPVPQSVPERIIPLTREGVPPEMAAELTFTFQQMRIDGATALSSDELMVNWPHQPGDVVAMQDVFQFASAITRAYAEAGYGISFGIVPEQEIRDGVVTVRVVEGFIVDVRFQDDEDVIFKGSTIRERANRIASSVLASKPLRTADLERYILLVDDLPGIEVAATLVAAPDTFGASVLQIDLRRQFVEVQASYNNFLPETLDRHAIGGSVQVNGVLTGAERIRIGGLRSVTSDAYLSVSGDVSAIVNSDGLRVGASASYSESDPTDSLLTTLEYSGRNTFASVYASYPVIRARSENLTVGVSASLSNSESDILSTSLTEDHLRTLEASATYDFVDAARGINYVRFGVERGLDVLNATGNSRANGSLEYTTLALQAQTDRPIISALDGTIAARLAMRGQTVVGGDGVFSAAECGYGGRQFGRGFESSIMLAEHCVFGSAELRWQRSLNFADVGIYGFVDGGLTRQKGTLESGDVRQRTAGSAGGGLRIGLREGFFGTAELAVPIKDPTDVSDVDDLRVNVSVGFSF